MLNLTLALTAAIDQSPLPVNMNAYRGANPGGLSGLLGISLANLESTGEEQLNRHYKDQVVKDPAFTSVSTNKEVCKNGTFVQGVLMTIHLPKGTKGLYAEPFSAYGTTAPQQDFLNHKSTKPSTLEGPGTVDQNGVEHHVPIWDGVTKPIDQTNPGRLNVGTEAEIILQRGMSFIIEEIKIVAGTTLRRIGPGRGYEVVLRAKS
jgi:hypothetical protein